MGSYIEENLARDEQIIIKHKLLGYLSSGIYCLVSYLFYLLLF